MRTTLAVMVLCAACRTAGSREATRTAASADPGQWRWHEASVELYEPAFSPDGSEVAFVRKRHVPDGHEAESTREAVLEQLHQAIQKDPRYADPEVVVVAYGSATLRSVDWGWTPAFSPDGSAIAYA